MTQIAATGATWLRIDYSNEYALGQLNTNLDPMVEAAEGAGLNVDAILDVPDWARSSAGVTNVPETVAFIEQAAAHLAALRVNTFEIINEPNLVTTANNDGMPPATYVSILQQVYPVIHSDDKGATILAGPSGLTSTTATSMTSQDYLTAMYADGAEGYFDALAMHPYIYPYVPEMDLGWNPWTTIIPELHQIMAANGDGNKEIWYTEFGAPTAGDGQWDVTQQVQALTYLQGFAMARSLPYSGPLFAFNWYDSADGDYGLHTASGQAKPALTAFEQGIAGSGVTASAAAASNSATTPSTTSTLTSPSSTSFTVGTAQTFTVTTSTGNSSAVAEVGTLPPGLSYADGVLWGIPAASGSYKVWLEPNLPGAAPQALTITVGPPA